ncbi:MAG: DUF4185 domain-containing protein [Myxococcales bacterium]|nr:DUF4185 domain-containing protein [Myxococcales bacterium]
MRNAVSWWCMLLFGVLLGCERSPNLGVDVQETGILEASPLIKGRDGGYSGLFGGRSIWVFGDTILTKEGVDKSSWRHNSWSWTTDLSAKDGITGFQEDNDTLGVPKELFPKTDAEATFNEAHKGDPCKEKPCGARYALWPGALVEDTQRKRAFVFYTKIYGEPGEWNFHGVGHGVAQWDDVSQPLKRPVVRPGKEHPTLLFEASDPNFGSAAFVKDGKIYAYGCEKAGFSKPCHLGRVSLETPLKPDAWEFYAGGNTWSSQVQDAKSLFDGAPMLTIHWNAYLKAYLAVYSRPLSTEIVIRTSPTPEGPWSGEQVIFQAKASHDGAAPYSGLGHGEYAEEGGKVEYITYYRSPAAWEGEFRVLRVTFGAP